MLGPSLDPRSTPGAPSSHVISDSRHILFQTLENLLVSAKKGNTINEADIPPPVASGKGPAAVHSHTVTASHLAPVSPPAPESSITLEAPTSNAPTSAKPQLPPGKWVIQGLCGLFRDLKIWAVHTMEYCLAIKRN